MKLAQTGRAKHETEQQCSKWRAQGVKKIEKKIEQSTYYKSDLKPSNYFNSVAKISTKAQNWNMKIVIQVF